MDDHSNSLAAVRDDGVRFVTTRPTGSRSATLERRVVVSGPPALVELTQHGTVADLEALVALLREPGRSWAAEVMLAAMTRREEKLVDAYQGRPDQWWADMGASAYDRWSHWLHDAKDRLAWQPAENLFVEQPVR
jgi:hypothetical protein